MLKFAIVLLTASAIALPAIAQEKLLRVYNWSDYIDPQLLRQFSDETGIRVIYDTYDSNELLETKLLTGNSGYDIVVPSGSFMQRQIRSGVFQKIDRSRLRNAGGIWPEVDRRLANYDPGNEHAINYMWFTTGIAYDVRKVLPMNGGNHPSSWDLLFKPEEAKKYANCGIYVLDSPEDLFSIALHYLGFSPETSSPAEVNRAIELLAAIRRNVRKFHSSEYISALANGEICIAVAWAGDAYQARNRAKEAGKEVDIQFVIPSEGTLMSMDNIGIPKDAVNIEEAYLFIDFLLRPEIAARNTAVTNFANGVLASHPFVPPEILANRSIYPDSKLMERLFTVSSREPAIQRLLTRGWTRIKTGR